MRLGTLMTGSLIALGALTQVANADTILLFGDHAGRERVASVLADEGHSVATAERLPPRLDNFEVVWHVGAVAALSEDEQKLLAAFVNRGGGLYLSGDGPGAEAMNASVETLVNLTIAGGGVTLSAVPQPSSGHHTFQVDALGDASVAPNDLYFWHPTVAGSLDNVAPIDVLTTGADGRTTSAVWAGPEMSNGRGQLVVMMDSGWVTSPYPIRRIIENLERFLREGVAPICGNAVAELGETCDDANAIGGDGCDASCQAEPTTGAPDDDAARDPSAADGEIPDGADAPDEVDNLAYVGCSATGGAGGGLLVALALLGLVLRRR